MSTYSTPLSSKSTMPRHFFVLRILCVARTHYYMTTREGRCAPYPGSMTTGTILLLPFFSAAKLNSSLQLSPALSLATLSMYLKTNTTGTEVRSGQVRSGRFG